MNAKGQALQRAQFWKASENNELDCFLCCHSCHIRVGKRGVCGVRENRDGTLYTLVYGRVIAENPDPIEKKPLYHFLPGTMSYSIATPGCNFKCGFCQNWQISQEYGDVRNYGDRSVEPSIIVNGAIRTRCASIAFTYTEPTIFMEYALDVARLAKQEGLKNAFVTNGYESPEAIKAMTGLIDAANIDLKSFSDEFYRSSCHGRLQPVLDSIKGMFDAGIHVEVTTLLVTGQNDSDEELTQIASFLAGISPDIPWHISRFHPDYRVLDSTPTPLSTIDRAAKIGDRAGLRYIYVGNVRDTDRQHTKCSRCGKTLITRSIMRVVENRLDKDCCPDCGARVPIVI